MKQLIIKLILPLTIISFGTITKWWYTLPVDAPDTMYYGFPFPYVGNGWHTSMSLQIFATEFLIDFLAYFLCWFSLFFLINRFMIKIHTHKVITICLWFISSIFIFIACFLTTFPDNFIYTNRNYEMEIMETGHKFIWQNIDRPDYNKYHPVDENK